MGGVRVSHLSPVPYTFVPRTPDEAVEAIRPFLDEGCGIATATLWLIGDSMRTAQRDPTHKNAVSWARTRETIYDRVRAGFAEHGGDLWTPHLSLAVYDTEAREEMADLIAYQAMASWQVAIQEQWP